MNKRRQRQLRRSIPIASKAQHSWGYAPADLVHKWLFGQEGRSLYLSTGIISTSSWRRAKKGPVWAEEPRLSQLRAMSTVRDALEKKQAQKRTAAGRGRKHA